MQDLSPFRKFLFSDGFIFEKKKKKKMKTFLGGLGGTISVFNDVIECFGNLGF